LLNTLSTNPFLKKKSLTILHENENVKNASRPASLEKIGPYTHLAKPDPISHADPKGVDGWNGYVIML
jgi:hypothetical protein